MIDSRQLNWFVSAEVASSLRVVFDFIRSGQVLDLLRDDLQMMPGGMQVFMFVPIFYYALPTCLKIRLSAPSR